jgi:tight adherence protein B
VITIIGGALCAGLAVGSGARAILLVDQVRITAALRSRLGVEAGGRSASRVRAALDPLVGSVRAWFDRSTGADRRRLDRRALLLIDAVTRRVRSGASIRAAVVAAAAEAPAAIDRSLASALTDGMPVREALDLWMADAAPARVLVGTALQLAAETGGAIAVVLDGVAETLRDRLHLEREVAALASQARASALVLIVAPIGFAILMSGVDPRITHVQFGTPLGWICCLVGIVLDLLGGVWMARMIGRAR